MSETRSPKPHALIFPYPYQGHLTPTLFLAANLASSGFTVTYVLPEFLHRAVDIPDESGLDVRFAAISDGFPLDYDRDRNFIEYWEGMVRDFPARVDELIESMKKTGLSRDGLFLVADTLYTWTSEIAEKHKIVHVSLWTEAAMVFAIDYHLELLRENGHFGRNGNADSVIKYIPGVESIGMKDLMSEIQHPDAIPLVTDIVAKAFHQVKNADFILCNTVQELEPQALLALARKQRTYAIGPINFANNFSNHILQRIGQRPQSDCTPWLDSKPPSSVLYISFGSITQINRRQILEIAHGLLVCEVNFLWVLRFDNDETDVFPSAFFDDVKDRGVVVPWCDQRKVLSNPAVGGFLTHCGWNSVLESMWNGVPMICYPFFADQPTNRKLVVDDWKIGINLCDGGEVDREEFASKVNVLMKGNACVELRAEAIKVRANLRNALQKGGSSSRNFDRFLQDLNDKLRARKEGESKN